MKKINGIRVITAICTAAFMLGACGNQEFGAVRAAPEGHRMPERSRVRARDKVKGHNLVSVRRKREKTVLLRLLYRRRRHPLVHLMTANKD